MEEMIAKFALYAISCFLIGAGAGHISEFADEDDMRDFVDSCLNDLENRSISSFTVSRLSQNRYQKPFWEKKDKQ